MAVKAAVIKHMHGVPFADSLITSTANVIGFPCYADDPHFRTITGVAVKWLR